MFTTCLRCDRDLGRNTDLHYLPIGRRIAFDRVRGRIWVICLRCGQWNLVPIESRWEALEECDRVAPHAEVRVNGGEMGFAGLASGTELLRVGGLPDSDIANWRYGPRMQWRKRVIQGVAATLCGLTIIVGTLAWRKTHALAFAGWASLFIGTFGYSLWRSPPRPWLILRNNTALRGILWYWELREICWATRTPRPVLIVPWGWRASRRLSKKDAASFFAELLPKLAAGDLAGASVVDAVSLVSYAEEQVRGNRRSRRARRQSPQPAQTAWEWLATPGAKLAGMRAESRIALEMAVNEHLESAAFASRASAKHAEWLDEEEVGSIADDLLLPDDVVSKLRDIKRRHT